MWKDRHRKAESNTRIFVTTLRARHIPVGLVRLLPAERSSILRLNFASVMILEL